MSSLACTVDGWRARALKTWYPTDGSWRATSATQPINASISCPTFDDGSRSDNMFTVCIKVTTPTDTTIGTINQISISFYVGDRNTTTGTMYGSLRTVDTASGSSADDTIDTYRTNVAGGSAEASVTGITTTEAKYTMTFNGTFEQGTSYYLYLYTKSTNDVYSCTPHSTYYTSECMYTIKSYIVSYNANGHGTAPDSQTKLHGQELILSYGIPGVPDIGYTVSYNSNGSSETAPSSHVSDKTWVQLNWNTNGDGSGTTYTVGGSYTEDADIELYAIWSYTLGRLTVKDAITRNNDVSAYTISYNANGGNSTPSNQTLNLNTPYTFKEWRTSSSGTSGVAHNPGDLIQPTADTTLYAIWNAGDTTGSVNLASAINKASTTESGYTVTLNPNGGTLDTTSLTTTNTRSYVFNKWNTAPDGSGISYSAEEAYSTAADVALYATFNSSITAVSPVNLPIPKKSGYKFVGWSTTDGGTAYVDRNYIPNGNTTLYANYKEGYDIEMHIYTGGRWMNVLMDD